MNTMNFLLSESATGTNEEFTNIVNSMKGYLPKIIDFGVNVLLALLILFVGKFIIKWLLKICNKFFEKAKVEISIQRFLNSLIKVALYVLLIIIILTIAMILDRKQQTMIYILQYLKNKIENKLTMQEVWMV